MESFDAKLQRVLAEDVALVPYNPAWPALFQQEATHLRACLPPALIGRIEHFGSTAVPGLCAKPIVDLLVEVFDLETVRRQVPPILEAQGYDYFWRPSFGDDIPPWYAWFIKRDNAGPRTHHLHMIEPQFEHWERLKFRDHLRAHPAAAAEYAALKWDLAARHAHDRVAYTAGKTAFIARIMATIGGSMPPTP